MSIFETFLRLGFSHIADFKGYDHILFITTLCGIYAIKQWKPVLILVTAFTIGHSITLALAALHIITLSTTLIEFLIAVTIFLTSVFNIIYKKTTFSRSLHHIKYGSAMFFGLIHGVGFSVYLRSLLGMESNIVVPLFAFNVGLEIGQITIVFSILALGAVFVTVLKVPRREWNLVISSAAGGIALIMMIERWPF